MVESSNRAFGATLWSRFSFQKAPIDEETKLTAFETILPKQTTSIAEEAASIAGMFKRSELAEDLCLLVLFGGGNVMVLGGPGGGGGGGGRCVGALLLPLKGDVLGRLEGNS